MIWCRRGEEKGGGGGGGVLGLTNIFCMVHCMGRLCLKAVSFSA